LIPRKELNKFSFEINDDDVVSSDGKSESDDTEDKDNDEEATHEARRPQEKMIQHGRGTTAAKKSCRKSKLGKFNNKGFNCELFLS
jgi:hypothetical protein